MTMSLALLRQSHETAARAMMTQALKPGINPEYLVVGQSEVRPDGDGLLPVYIDSDAYNDPTWLYRGSVNMRYKRVDLNTAFGRLNLRCHVGAEYTTAKVVARLKEVFGLDLNTDEFIEEVFPMTKLGQFVSLKATADNLRWKGQVNVFVYR